MYTFCPNCFAVYQVTPELIDKAAGRTRCSGCQQVYRAVDYLFDDLATTRSVADEQRSAAGQSEADDAGWELGAESRSADRLPASAWQRQAVSMADIGSGVAIVFLALLLAGQWVYLKRDALATEQAWRPVLEPFCEVLHCDLPLRVDLAQVEIMERDVRKHPAADDALLINVTFENRAEFVQPYPLFEVSFTDMSGHPVAIRRFSPAEYLGEDVPPEAGISPQIPVHVLLEVLDPGTEAVSFQFGFL